MAKYCFDFKKKIVLSYLNGEGGYGYLAKKCAVHQSYSNNPLHTKMSRSVL